MGKIDSPDTPCVVLGPLHHEVVFRGTFAQCEHWLLSRAEVINDRKFYRFWQENDITYCYDVGPVYRITLAK